MQSSNPVFRRSEGFNGKATASGMTYPAYGSQPQARTRRRRAPTPTARGAAGPTATPAAAAG